MAEEAVVAVVVVDEEEAFAVDGVEDGVDYFKVGGGVEEVAADDGFYDGAHHG